MKNNNKITSLFLTYLVCFCYLHEAAVKAAAVDHLLKSSQHAFLLTDAEPSADDGIQIDGVKLGKQCIKSLMKAIPPDFCWRKEIGKPISACPEGMTRQGLLCYQNCKEGYHNIIGVCWENGCREGYHDFGLTCTNKRLHTYSKNSYMLPFPKPMVCAPGLNYESGLCYKGCERLGLVSCGIGACASSGPACTSAIIKIVTDVLSGILDLVTLIASFGASAPESIAAKTAVETAAKKAGAGTLKGVLNNLKNKLMSTFREKLKEGALAFAKKEGTEFVKKQAKKIPQLIANEIVLKFCDKVFEDIVGKTTKASTDGLTVQKVVDAVDVFNIKGAIEACSNTEADKGIKCAQTILRSVAMVDPTGILTIAAAFVHPSCPDPLPTLTDYERGLLGGLANNCVTFFTDGDFEGNVFEMCSDGNVPSQYNDQVSSLIVPPATTVMLYQDDGYRGRTAGPYTTGSYNVPADFNDQLTSVRVFSSCVSFFTDGDFKGNKFTMCSSGNVPNQYNDQVSSFIVPAGVTLTMYWDSDYNGKSLGPYTEGRYNMPSNFNDQVSSAVINVKKCVIFFTDGDFHGDAFQMCSSGNVPSRYNDQVSSFIVPAGVTVTLYWDNDYGGKSSGPYTGGSYNVPGNFNDQLSSVKISN